MYILNTKKETFCYGIKVNNGSIEKSMVILIADILVLKRIVKNKLYFSIKYAKTFNS